MKLAYTPRCSRTFTSDIEWMIYHGWFTLAGLKESSLSLAVVCLCIDSVFCILDSVLNRP